MVRGFNLLTLTHAPSHSPLLLLASWPQPPYPLPPLLPPPSIPLPNPNPLSRLTVRAPAKAGRAHLLRFHAEHFIDTLYRADAANYPTSAVACAEGRAGERIGGAGGSSGAGGGGAGGDGAGGGGGEERRGVCNDDMETEDEGGERAEAATPPPAVPLVTLEEYGLVDDCEVFRGG